MACERIGRILREFGMELRIGWFRMMYTLRSGRIPPDDSFRPTNWRESDPFNIP